MIKVKNNVIFIFLMFILLISSGLVKASDTVSYRTHVQNVGWMNEVANGQTSGTEGKSLRVEAIEIKVNDPNSSITYNTHVQNIGWMSSVSNGQLSGTTGQSLRVEAINIKLGGKLSETYDIYYKVHVQDIGWMGWAKNGQSAGTTGGSKRVEAIQIQLIPKGSTAPGSTQNYFKDFLNPANNGSGTDTPSTTTNSGLSVKGTQLVQNETPVQLKGISTHGINWFPEYVNQALFTELKNNWNANTVRLAMYTTEYNGYCSGGNKESLKTLVKQGINYASNAGLYVIVDWHVLNDRDPNIYKEDAKAFFNEISATYANNTNIIYEICNEPNGGTSWSQIKSYAQEIIPVIRKNDNDAIIIVGTPNWSQNVDEALKDPINDSNIMYSFHFYAGTHKTDMMNKLENAVKGGLPVFVTEFGTCDASGNGNLDLSSSNSWMNLLNKYNISYINWSMTNKNETASLLNPSTTKTSGFIQNDLSESGKWFYNILKSSSNTSPSVPSQPTVSEDTTPADSSTPNTPSTSNGKVTYSVKETNSWSDGTNYFKQFSLTITNSTSEIITWNTQLSFSNSFTLENIWNANYSKSGNSLNVSGVDYNKQISPGSNTEIGFIVKSSNSNLTCSVK